ncbi:hypothetical protein BGZ51_002216 [Haplosporangium sp. Z 767]|nr:hypothetical protein BGZ51_002216 [Haplosporangium sp. Z 767]KAF9188547.1 hypothetical protein BGZ50_001269 [Haplosporangium sp. Z 11]
MGVLQLVCATADEAGSTLYGLAYGPDYSVTDSSSNNYYERVILIKSNAYPNTAADMVWSLVSAFRRDKLIQLRDSSVTCAIDDQGVFTAIASSTTSSAVTEAPGGFQYNPLKSIPKEWTQWTTGSGTWSNVTFAAGYGWENEIQSSLLFHIKTAAGENQLVHAVAGGSKGGINFGTSSAIGNDAVQFVNSAFWPLMPAMPDSYLLFTASAPSASSSMTESVYMFRPTTSVKTFTPMSGSSGSGSGSIPFIFIQTKNSTHSLILSGNNTSHLYSGPQYIQIKESLGRPPSNTDDDLGSNSDSGGDLPTGAIIGITLGCLSLVICCLITLCRAGGKSKKQKTSTTIYHTPEIVSIGPTIPAIYHHHHQQQDLMAHEEIKGNFEVPTSPELLDLSHHPRPHVTTTMREHSNLHIRA